MNSKTRSISTRIRRAQWGSPAIRLLGLGLLLITGCGLEAPESPQWSVSLSLPVANRHVDGSYLAAHADIDALRWSTDSGLVWRISEELDTIHASDFLNIAGVTRGTAVALGDFIIGSGTATQSTLALSELHPEPVGFIAAFSAETQRELPSLTAIDSAVIASGQIQIEIKNQLGIALDSVHIILTNVGDGLPFAEIPVPGPIATGDSAIGTGDLAGQTITADWQYRLRFYTPGGTILSADDKYAAIIASLPDGVHAEEAHAVVDALSASASDSAVFVEDHVLSAAQFATGSLRLDWANNTSLPVTVSWSCPDLTDGGGPLSGITTISPDGSAAVVHDLTDAQFSGTTASTVHIDIAVESAGSGGQPVSLRASDEVSCDLSWEDVSLASATGILHPTTHDTGPLSAQVEWDHGLEDAGFDDWDVFLEITSAMPVSAWVSGRLTTDTDLDVAVFGTIQAGSPADPVTTSLAILVGDTPLRPLPGRVAFEGAITCGDRTTPVTIDRGDFLTPRVIVSAASDIYVDGVTLTDDARAAELFSENADDRTNRLIAGELELVVSNRFPIGALFTLRLASDSGTVATEPQVTFGPATISPAATDADGRATAAESSTIRFTVGSEDISLFERDTIWIAESIELLGPGAGQPARVALEDYLDWTATLRLDVLVGDEDGE
ncbi:MAG TPA: hypothetical protein VM118_08305 [Acidobacteriota bacterium]|nr:hypothetical protein [Acidobacteriota bacterium]